jgi:tetratricopeptide (TPR) repeat protein
MKIIRMQGRFRWKSILIVVLVCAFLSVGWHFLHRYQVTAMQPELLEQATRAERSTPPQPEVAMQFLRNYLRLQQDDVDAGARLGGLVEKHAKTGRDKAEALSLYEVVLEQDPSRQDIRIRAAKLCVELGRYDQALTHLAHLKQTSDPEVDVLQGNCKEAKVRSIPTEKGKQEILQEAAGHYRDAIGKSSQQLAAYARLASLLRSGKLPEDGAQAAEANKKEAVKIMDDMVANNPKVVDAYLGRAIFRESALRADQDLPGAGKDLEIARRLVEAEIAAAASAKPTDNAKKLHATVLLASAINEWLLGAATEPFDLKSPHFDQSRSYLQGARQLYPEDTRILPARADLERKLGRRAEAIAALKTAQKEASGQERNRLLGELATLLIDDFNADPKQLTANRAAVTEVLQEMRKGKVPPQIVDFLEARVLLSDSQWQAAAAKLERARPLLVEDANRAGQLPVAEQRAKGLLLQAELLLGSCYGQLGDWDQQLVVYKSAVKNHPDDPNPRRSLVSALSAQGRLEDALEECRTLKELKTASLEDEITYARLRISKRLKSRQSVDARFWDEMGKELSGIRSKLVGGGDDGKRWLTAIDMLRAEMKVFQFEAQKANGNAKEAEASFKEAWSIMTELKKADPDKVDRWISLAVLAARKDGVPAAQKLLDEAQAKFGDVVEVRLARLRFVPGNDKKAALAYLQPLAENLERFDQDRQTALLSALALAYESADANATAEKLWQRLVELEPKQLRVGLAFFEFYARAKNRAGMAKALQGIRAIEETGEAPGRTEPTGKFGLFGEAQILLLEAEDGKLPAAEIGPRVDKAEKYLLAAEARDRNWSRIPEGLAVVAGHRKDAKKEIEYLRRAVELGSRQMIVVGTLIDRLIASGRTVEADDLLFKLQQAEPINSDLLKLAAGLSATNKNTVRALSLAQSAVAKSKEDYKDYLWYGQMLGKLAAQSQGDARLKSFKDGEAALQTAIDLAKGAPEPWVALVRLQASAGALDKAKATMELMKGKIPEWSGPLATALCYFALNDRVKAEKAFADGVAAAPKDGSDDALAKYRTVVQMAAQFQFDENKPAKAEPLLRILLEPKWKSPDVLRAWARRHLALSLWYQGNSSRLEEAKSLVQENLKSEPNSPDDQIVQGFLLTARLEGRPEAIKILEKAFAVKEPTADQIMLLSNLYEAGGDWKTARDKLSTMLAKHHADPKYPDMLAIFIGKLVDHNELEDALGWLDALQKIRPHSFGTVDRLVRLQAKRNQPDEIARPIRKFLESKDKDAQPADPADRLTLVALLLGDLLRQHPSQMTKIRTDNEKFIKAAVAKTTKKESMLAVADFLGHCQRLDESLDLCEKAFKDLPATAVLSVAVGAVAANVATPKQVQRVEALVQEAMAKETKAKSTQKEKADGVVWEAYLAVLKEREARYEEAEALYRKVIARLPENAVALNNLSFLLALRGHADEARSIIEKVIAITGPNAEILDTRGVIWRTLGKLAEAEKDIQAALKQERTAYRLFHLALVHEAAERQLEALQAFHEALDLGLATHNGMLHPLERGAYQRLLGEHEKAVKNR